MRVAVTGATGFVGGNLVDALRRRGDEIACLVRRDDAASQVDTLAGCRCVRGDLDDTAALAALVEGAEVVYHVAGRIAARTDTEFLRTNRDGTARVVEAAARAGVRRLLHVSSQAVTGPGPAGVTRDESGTPTPVTPYGR